MKIRKMSIITVSLLVLFGCGEDKDKKYDGAGIPYVAPPVESVTPEALKTASSMSLKDTFTSYSLGASNFKSRFFEGGPTEIRNLLNTIDQTIAGINSRSTEEDKECLKNTPVEYSMSVAGDTHTYYFQCSDDFGNGDFALFGKKDSTWYYYSRNGQGISAFKVTPNSTDSSLYNVDAYMTVGRLNGTGSDGACSVSWDNCSYGLTHLVADTSTKMFEMTTAGIGVGYCGAHMISNGDQIFISGSEDGPGCGAVDTGCFSGLDLSTATTCDLSETQFTLTSLGRTTSAKSSSGSWAAHPAITNVTLDGTTTDTSHFGPSSVSDVSGVSAF